ncbi:Detected protein of unknown function [Hibiscus syriacus]|uniref:DUF7870 domain-containing protein n=1 Tax=Hibiscus syriacus TaxID=106335 RepID=A0A6A3B726_HIBSY|nr:Detected protein of unknown function [Hibiscus syriacus]
MEPSKLKPNLLKNILVRFLSFGVLIFAVAFLIALRGQSFVAGDDFCLFNVRHMSSVAVDSAKRYIHYYTFVFRDLIAYGYLSPNSKSLCIETLTGEEVHALETIGVSDSIGISKKPSRWKQPFKANTFDFDLKRLREFGFPSLVQSSEINGPDPPTKIQEIVMKKEKDRPQNKSTIQELKREKIRNAEPLIQQEPLRRWITRKRNIENIKYLTSMVDISFKRRYIYIDGGARSYESSIGNWIKKQYPKQNKNFEIYAIEADKAFHQEYKSKKGVNLLPYTAWIRNETLFFEINRDPKRKSIAMQKGRGDGEDQPDSVNGNLRG